MPAVSIVMPAYNAEEYIEMSIESICAQTFEDWELLVTDDGSSDKTSKIIHKHSAINKRIKYHNGNISQAAKSLGLTRATIYKKVK